MFTITKEFSFSAAHHLTGLPDEHPCSRDHGHNYTVVVELQSDDLNGAGFVRDYGELRELGIYIDQNLDHRDLNRVLPFNPTAENLAYFLFSFARALWPETSAVRVSETVKTWAEYRPARPQPMFSEGADR